ncbi:MAG: YHS domain-containing (seleno)protein [Planctomycetota bacterium]
MTRFTFKSIFAAVVVISFVAVGLTAYGRLGGDDFAVRTTDENALLLIDADGTAIHGFDVVSYFTDGRPTKGQATFTSQYLGATWQFSDADHKRLFDANPDRYVPAYGGYCAWGVAAKNDLFDIDPNAWSIVDDTLYLNFNADVQAKWLDNVPGFIQSGDQNWQQLQNGV